MICVKLWLLIKIVGFYYFNPTTKELIVSPFFINDLNCLAVSVMAGDEVIKLSLKKRKDKICLKINKPISKIKLDNIKNYKLLKIKKGLTYNKYIFSQCN